VKRNAFKSVGRHAAAAPVPVKARPDSAQNRFFSPVSGQIALSLYFRAGANDSMWTAAASASMPAALALGRLRWEFEERAAPALHWQSITT
jgi:hypothetical protein